MSETRYYDPVTKKPTWNAEQLAVGPRQPCMDELARLQWERDKALAKVKVLEKKEADDLQEAVNRACWREED